MYNAERFVGTTIDSILAQTFQDFELIVVDDHSTDHSYDLIDNYSDPRIKLFRRARNLGRSSARNFGLDLASGEYIYFMDHDDAILPQTLEIFYNAAKESQVDVLYINSFFETTTQNFSLDGDIEVEKHFSRDATPRNVSQNLVNRLQEEYIFGGTMVNTWIRFSRRKCLVDNGIFFPDLPRNEDGLVHLATLCLADKIQVIDDCCYIHHAHSSNAMSQSADKQMKLTLESFVPAIKYMENILDKTNLSRENRAMIEAFTLKEMIRWLIVQKAYAGEMSFDEIDDLLNQNLNLDRQTNRILFHVIALVMKWIYCRSGESIFELKGEVYCPKCQ